MRVHCDALSIMEQQGPYRSTSASPARTLQGHPWHATALHYDSGGPEWALSFISHWTSTDLEMNSPGACSEVLSEDLRVTVSVNHLHWGRGRGGGPFFI